MSDGSEKPNPRRIKLKVNGRSITFPLESAAAEVELKKDPAGYQRLHGKMDLLMQPSSQDEQTARLIKRMKMQAGSENQHQLEIQSKENYTLKDELRILSEECNKLNSIKGQVETKSNQTLALRDELKKLPLEKLTTESNTIMAELEKPECQKESSNLHHALRCVVQRLPEECEKAKCEELQLQVHTLSCENHDLRDKLQRNTEKSEKLALENIVIKAKCEGLEHQVENLSNENHALRDEKNSIKEELIRMWALYSRFIIETKDYL